MNPSISLTGAPSNSPTEVPVITVDYSLNTEVQNVNPDTFNATAFQNGAQKTFEAKVCNATDPTETCEVTVTVSLVPQRRLSSDQPRMRKLQTLTAKVEAEIKIEKKDPGLNSENGFQASSSAAIKSAEQGQTELITLVTNGNDFLSNVTTNDPLAIGLENGEYS